MKEKRSSAFARVEMYGLQYAVKKANDPKEIRSISNGSFKSKKYAFSGVYDADKDLVARSAWSNFYLTW